MKAMIDERRKNNEYPGRKEYTIKGAITKWNKVKRNNSRWAWFSHI